MSRPSAITIGNFDGVHAGHRHIMRRVVEIGRENNWMPVVLTFDPHPMRLVAPERAPRLLTPLDRRRELMLQEGIENVTVLPFTADVAALTPEEFVKQVLVDQLNARAVLVGENFRFGHKAAGTTATLRELGRKYGFLTEAVSSVRHRYRVVSSSEIRRLLEAGQVSWACRMLGRPFSIEGRIVPGHGVGSKKTVPTLNLETAAEVLPGRGVYVTRTYDVESDRDWESITNVGYRPTFDGDVLTIETFLLSKLAGDTPASIRLEFLHRVRDEKKFESPEALKVQILRDVARAQTYFRRRARKPQPIAS